MLEKDIENWVTKQVETLGGLSFKFVSPGNPGVPDRIYLFPGGRVFFVELKLEIGKLSGVQKWQRQRFEKMGVDFYVLHGMKEAKEFVKELRNEVFTLRIPEGSGK